MITRLLPRLLLGIAILGIAVIGFFASQNASRNSAQPPPRPTDGGAAQAWLFNQRAYPLTTIPAGATMNGWLASVQAGQAPSEVDQWTSIGPAPVTGGQFEGTTANPRVSGRIIDIAVDPNQPATHWFAAVEFGGIWETTDGGTSWTSKTDTVLTQGMSTIAIAASNPQILFAGTHDISGVGVALLKSIDGGSNWVPTGTGSFFDQGSFTFTAIEVHPFNPNTVMAVTWQGSQPANGGVFKSTDGGATFTQKLPGTGTALHVNPTDFNQQYASIYGATQYNGIYRSFNGGDTWMEMSGPWDPAMAQGGGAVEICGAPSSPGTVYVVVPGGGMWKTQNAWAFIPTWTALPAAPGGFNSPNTAMVDPTDPSIFYIGGWGGPFYRLNANGIWTWILPSTHVDQHALAAAGSTILLGNDGGFWTSTDRGGTWTNKNSNLATITFYAGSLHPTDALQALGGSQDNGTEWWTGNVAWKFVWYGDGGYSAFGVSNSDAWLVSSQVLGIIRLSIGGTVHEWGQNGLDNIGAGFIAPIRRSPHGDVVLAGSDNLWKSTNFFNTAVQPLWFNNGPEMGSQISAIAFAPFDTSSLTYAFGTGDGALRSTTSGGLGKWKNLDPAPGTVPNRFVKGIAYHPTDPNIMYVSLSGFDENTPGAPGHVFKTVNATAASPTWTNVSPGLAGQPAVNLPINCLAIDPATPTTIYAGADLGVWKSTNSGGSGSWAFMGPGKGMPNVPVFDLLFSPVDGRLVAYTYGRGAFKLNVGSLQVTILPAGAVTAGAKWKVDNGVWQDSGTTVTGLATGNHTLSFKPIAGWQTPANQSVTISNNQTTQATGGYQSDS